MMRSRVRVLICGLSALLLCGSVRAAEPVDVPLVIEGQRVDGPTLAYMLTKLLVSDDQWRAKLKKVRQQFDTFENDTNHEIDQFLNDQLIIEALSAAGGEPEKIKDALTWMALYYEFGQQPPSIVHTFMDEHQESLKRLVSGFTLEKATDYVKNKRWREDLKDGKPINPAPKEPQARLEIPLDFPKASKAVVVAQATPAVKPVPEPAPKPAPVAQKPETKPVVAPAPAHTEPQANAPMLPKAEPAPTTTSAPQPLAFPAPFSLDWKDLQSTHQAVPFARTGRGAAE